MFDLAFQTLEMAKTAGADQCRVAINRDRSVEISYRDHQVETIKEAGTRGLFLEVFVNNRYSSQYTSDLRPAELKGFVVQAIATTRLLEEDPFRTLPDPRYYEGRAPVDLKRSDPAFSSLSTEQMHEIARDVGEAAQAKAGPRMISVTSSCAKSWSENVRLSSNGFEGGEENTCFSSGASISLQDEGDRRPCGDHFAEVSTRAELPPAEAIGAEAAQRSLDLLGAKKVKTETLPVIVENRSVPRLLGGLVAAMSGASLQQKQSFLMGKKGQAIASERFTLVDDPFIPGGFGSRLFDGDGFPARRRMMVDAGVLRDYYISWYYSRKLGCEPTSGGASNLVIAPGSRSVAEIMKSLGRGVLVREFIGGNSNSTTGDMSVGIVGTLFANGVPTQPIAEMNIAANHLQLWSRVAEVANDPWLYSSRRTPSVVFRDVVVSGI